MDTVPGDDADDRNSDTLQDDSSGVGMLGKTASVFSALESGPQTLAQLVSTTHLTRPTVHRLVVALGYHRPVARDMQGRLILSPRLGELASTVGEDHLLTSASPVLVALCDHTGESAQFFRRQEGRRVYVAAAKRTIGLRDPIPIGATLSMKTGSAAQVLLAWKKSDRLHRDLHRTNFTATNLSAVRRRGWAQSISEREIGMASISTPVCRPSSRIIAAVSISGPVECMGHQPGRQRATAAVTTAQRLTDILRATEGLGAGL